MFVVLSGQSTTFTLPVTLAYNPPFTVIFYLPVTVKFSLPVTVIFYLPVTVTFYLPVTVKFSLLVTITAKSQINLFLMIHVFFNIHSCNQFYRKSLINKLMFISTIFGILLCKLKNSQIDSNI